jgi:hypothetical protein
VSTYIATTNVVSTESVDKFIKLLGIFKLDHVYWLVLINLAKIKFVRSVSVKKKFKSSQNILVQLHFLVRRHKTGLFWNSQRIGLFNVSQKY